MPSDSVTVRARRWGPSLYAELIFAEWSVPAIGTHRSRGRLSSDAPPSSSRRRIMIVSLRWPLTSASSPIEALSGSPVSTPSRESDPTRRKFSAGPSLAASTSSRSGTRSTSSDRSRAAYSTPALPAAPTSMARPRAMPVGGRRSRLPGMAIKPNGTNLDNRGARTRARGQRRWTTSPTSTRWVTPQWSRTTSRPSGSTSSAVPATVPSVSSMRTARPSVASVRR